MAVTVSSFTASASGNTINYSITWANFTDCALASDRRIEFALIDLNRQAVIQLNPFTSVNINGTISSSFSSVFQGLFRVIARFKCGDITRVQSIFNSNEVDNSSTSTIAPPTGPSDPDPVTENPDSPEAQGICIPTTGAVSMGDLNVIFGRDRNLPNTLLSGDSNPSVAPSLFGISFLPDNIVSAGKLRPNAISEFRGYCHVPPIVPAAVTWNFSSNDFGTGTLFINFIDASDQPSNAGTSHNSSTSPQSSTGSFSALPGYFVNIDLQHSSFIPSLTSLSVIENGSQIYEFIDFSAAGTNFEFVAKNNGVYTINAALNGDDPFGGGGF